MSRMLLYQILNHSNLNKITGSNQNDGNTKDDKIVSPLKYFSNF